MQLSGLRKSTELVRQPATRTNPSSSRQMLARLRSGSNHSIDSPSDACTPAMCHAPCLNRRPTTTLSSWRRPATAHHQTYRAEGSDGLPDRQRMDRGGTDPHRAPALTETEKREPNTI